MIHHVIETDFETDDMIAMYAHASRSKNIKLTIIVGEGKPHNKIIFVEKFINCILEKYPEAYYSVCIFQGFGSDKKYPVDEQFTIIQDSEETILKNYKEIYATNPNVTYMLKPPREAFKLGLDCKNTVAYAYGSFNWRTLNLPVEDYQLFMTKYKKFYYYDSFTAIGENNSGLFIFKDNTNPVNCIIKEFIIKWNTTIIEKAQNDLLTEIDEKAIARKQKIIANISKGIDTQYVLADVCLFFLPEPTEQTKLDKIKPYSVWTPSADSNIYIYTKEGTDVRHQQLLNELSIFLDL